MHLAHASRSFVLMSALAGLISFGGSNYSANAQGFLPNDAAERMDLPTGIEVNVFASEPEIRQPVSMTFDERGRMWIIQYLQYPTPAGLQAVEVDQYLRTKYDKLPAPPPRGPEGADRITIAEDADGDGVADTFTDFVTGLNLATGLEIGHGGVFVVQAPYLLFYPDENRDDQPDSDPEVLLTGFGMEDSHAFANSLMWGPDGWLYGTQGSTVTANIRGIRFQQGIWRYHPLTDEFELFSEGGGNTWGLDFDLHGNVIAGTNYGNYAMLHQVQGAYYVKNFGKHGELQNPYAFGYFHHVPYKDFKGGHVTSGGIFYQADQLPEYLHGRYVAANLLSNSVHWHEMKQSGSSFKASHGGELIVANDTWFRAVDCALGPDGSIYVADWSDKRATHVDPKDDWDRTNGRIYRVTGMGAKPSAQIDLSDKTDAELIDMLTATNHYYRRTARRIMAERQSPGIRDQMHKSLTDGESETPELEALWALVVSGGFNESTAVQLTAHANEDIRRWAVRLMGDTKNVGPEATARLIEMARTESSVRVRNQLACTAKRLPGDAALPIIAALLDRDEDNDDPMIPLLLWWALESKAESHRAAILEACQDPDAWTSDIVRSTIIERLARRFAAAGGHENYAACAQLLKLAPNAESRDKVIAGLELGITGKTFDEVPAELHDAVDQLWVLATDKHEQALRVAIRLGDQRATERAIDIIEDPSHDSKHRASLMELAGEITLEGAGDALLAVIRSPEAPNTLRSTAMSALEPFANEGVAARIIADYESYSNLLRKRAVRLLAARAETGLLLMHAVDEGTIEKDDIELAEQRRMTLRDVPELTQLVEKHYGKIREDTDGILKGRVRGVTSILGLAEGDSIAGKVVFMDTCGKCHTLFDEGKEIGPDLTGADRFSREPLIKTIVDPSSVIRPEYINHIVEMQDGRLLTGLLAESTPESITLLDAEGNRILLNRSEIDRLRESSISLMPEELLDGLEPKQIQDLFAYLKLKEPLE